MKHDDNLDAIRVKIAYEHGVYTGYIHALIAVSVVLFFVTLFIYFFR